MNIFPLGLAEGNFFDMKVIRQADFSSSKWSGGTTTQWVISPENASLQERNFDWRISSAQVETEESDFTLFEGYERILIPLEGTLEMEHQTPNGSIRQKVGEFELARFSGSWPTKGKGKLTDFNLIFKSIYNPKIHISSFGEETALKIEETVSVVVVLQGAVRWNNETIKFPVILLNTAHQASEITCLPGSRLIFIEINPAG
ncbi:HutD [compost metagenome]